MNNLDISLSTDENFDLSENCNAVSFKTENIKTDSVNSIVDGEF